MGDCDIQHWEVDSCDNRTHSKGQLSIVSLALRCRLAWGLVSEGLDMRTDLVKSQDEETGFVTSAYRVKTEFKRVL